ncbi:AGAP000924-PA [Anopheles gambiae str. PEST]|uniref:AGAP000924-PA n=1 Tax=Anopheles gambiae TaxID=7165 RepID=A0NBT1_ANOGA|nr:AGAP000924-PA [Anopheles gambiae str. PEST]
MDEDINLSLDEIIRKRHVAHPKARSAPAGAGGKQPKAVGGAGPRGGGTFREENGGYRGATKPRPVRDARYKIIRNKRAKIRDARDHLTEQKLGRVERYRHQKRGRQLLEHGFRALMLPPSPPRGALAALSSNQRNIGGYGPAEHLQVQLHNRRRYVEPEYIPGVHTGMVPQPAPLSMSALPHFRGNRHISLMAVDDEDMDDDEEDEYEAYGVLEVDRLAMSKSLGSGGGGGGLLNASRTLHNDMYALPSSIPPFPRFRTVRATGNTIASATSAGTAGSNGSSMLSYSAARPSSSTVHSDDPFDHYEVNQRPNMSVPPPPLPVSSSSSSRPLRSILRTRPSTTPPPTGNGGAGVPANLSPSMRARLERAPNPNKSMGIFAHNFNGDPPIKNYRTRTPSPPPPPTLTTGYRIVVSNLHPSVTQLDIKELFEDIGDLLESRLVRPGIAEVIYRNLKDAERAVDAYHNRQLDGQPMNCLLVNPRATYKPTATTTSTAMKYGR